MKEREREREIIFSVLMRQLKLINISLNIMPCGVGHITKNSTNVFSACRKRRLKETGRGDWESPPL